MDRVDMTLDVDVQSERLKSLFIRLKLLGAQSTKMSLNELLLGYSSLRHCLEWLEKNPKGSLHEYLPELRLFASDFLLDRDVFGVLGLENLCELGLLNPSHWQDMQRKAALRDLDEIDQAVAFASCEDQSNHTKLLHPSIQFEIRRAICHGDLVCVQRLLLGQIHQVDSHTLTFSLIKDQLDIFWTLLEHGAMFIQDCADCLSYCPCRVLYTAAKRGHLDAVVALLDRGVGVDGSHRDGTYWVLNCTYTPLCGAASGGFLPIVQLLHRRGADVNGNTLKAPLTAAIEHGHLDIVLYLLEHVAITDSLLEEALSPAVETGNLALIKLVLSQPQIKCALRPLNRIPEARPTVYGGYRSEKPSYLLEYACDCQQFNIALELFSYGTNLGHKSRDYLLAGLISQLQKSNDFSEASRLAILHQDVGRARVYEWPDGWPQSLRILNGSLNDINARVEKRKVLEKRKVREKLLQYRPGAPEVRQRVLGSRLRWAFTKAYHRLLEGSTGSFASNAFTSFVSELRFRVTWTKGSSTIRKLIDRFPPQSLDQVISCLLVADAMRAAATLDKTPWERDNARNEYVVFRHTLNWRLTVSRFLSDLNRWRSLLQSDDEKVLYDEIIQRVWGPSPSPYYRDEEDVSMESNIAYLQSLVSSLASQTRSFIGTWDWNTSYSGGYRLQSMRRFHECNETESPINDHGEWERSRTRSAVTRDKPPNADRDKPNIALWECTASQYATAPQQIAVMLMAGAVFGIILNFLLGIARANCVLLERLLTSC
jgi:hypothetical protein